MSGVTRWNADVRCWHARRSPPSSTRKPAAIVRRARRQFVRCLGFPLESVAVLDLVTERLKPRPEILDRSPDRRGRRLRQCAAALFARICSRASLRSQCPKFQCRSPRPAQPRRAFVRSASTFTKGLLAENQGLLRVREQERRGREKSVRACVARQVSRTKVLPTLYFPVLAARRALHDFRQQ